MNKKITIIAVFLMLVIATQFVSGINIVKNENKTPNIESNSNDIVEIFCGSVYIDASKKYSDEVIFYFDKLKIGEDYKIIVKLIKLIFI